MENKTYLEGTCKNSDGKPCICINWENGTVEEPTFRKEYSDWMCIGSPQLVREDNRDKITKIECFEVYPAFMGYLENMGIVENWKNVGGKILDNYPEWPI
ncbi:hypothetical protein FDB15_17405 [Clostridium botulinum]|nr:hypothetical protein [Clostridium botulinum]NFI64804.1 hypothetical protein [Clostridium botulinum]NFJ45411.1 hypothetical protein [Clostridium botulinum]NFJ49081.1 hypothetical protein [Clostridium botulinum]NFK26965.1 hypothetical protein [Clostridium botulinum]